MIKGKKTKLRMFARDDIATYCELINNIQELGEYWPSFIRSPHNVAKAFEQDGMSSRNGRTMLVTDLDDKWIGEVAVRDFSTEIVGQSVSYRIFRSGDRGKGYMSEAVNLFCDWLFDVSPVKRLTILVVGDNEPSKKVAERCGFQLEGTMRSGVFVRGEYRNLVVYGRVR